MLNCWEDFSQKIVLIMLILNLLIKIYGFLDNIKYISFILYI